jgi:mannose/cellobiose epimerase-like protein (N-acyl-D-glucosamine 2-epimerase family)
MGCIEHSSLAMAGPFDESWTRAPDLAGRLVEPGHQFEWAWLLMRWEPARAEVREAAPRIVGVADRYGSTEEWLSTPAE